MGRVCSGQPLEARERLIEVEIEDLVEPVPGLLKKTGAA